MVRALQPSLACLLDPPAANPLRQPCPQAAHGNALPAFSNGFLTGWRRQTG